MRTNPIETAKAKEVNCKFNYLLHLSWMVSGASATLGIVASVLLHNAGAAVAGLGTAGLSFYATSASRERAAHTAATLLLSNDAVWEQKTAEIAIQNQHRLNGLEKERERFITDRLEMSRKLAEAEVHEGSRERQINDLNVEISQLRQERQTIERDLLAKLSQCESALAVVGESLEDRRLKFSVHLDAIEGQILAIWEPLHSGLIAICDRFDPTRPVTTLEYAGKPVTLSETERQQWKHYRESLALYDNSLRKHVEGMSDDCDTHDDAYGFFLRLLEDMTTSYCHLWSNIRDLEIGTTHEGQKRAIYEEFESFRSVYASDASNWVEQATKVDEGFSFIEQSFKNELASLQQRIIEAERLIEGLQAPHKFRGGTTVDRQGNAIIDHFASTGLIVDAIESVMIPGGFQLRFKIDRNPDSTRLTEAELDRHCDGMSLWGLSQRPLDFTIDRSNFLLTVNLYGSAEPRRRSPLTEEKRPSAKSDALDPEAIAARFNDLNCYSALEFEEVIRSKFVPRVRIVAGSTGGKSPLLELIACAIAKIHEGQIWLINPIPGSPKDWFHVPGLVPTGTNGIEAAINWISKAHDEFKGRRNDLPGTKSKPFITVVIDEINAIARDSEELGAIIKDFYQLSDHVRMGFLTAGQGGNVSGVSGGSQSKKKTGNASKLMEEDFQNATQVFTADAAVKWIKKYEKGTQMDLLLERLAALNKLCDELNLAEGKSATPKDPTIKKVSPDAYRIALVVPVGGGEPFFIQLPPYGSYAGQLDEVTYPASAKITAPIENQKALGLADGDEEASRTACPDCGSHEVRQKGVYKTTGRPRYVCKCCQKTLSTSTA